MEILFVFVMLAPALATLSTFGFTDNASFQATLGHAIAQWVAIPDKCARIIAVPQEDSSSFYAKVMRHGLPVILKDVKDLFGERVKRWGDVKHLIKEFGGTTHKVSLFNAKQNRPGLGMTSSAGDGVDRYGYAPVDDGAFLWAPYETEQSLSEVLTNNDSLQMSVMEKNPLWFHEEEEQRAGRPPTIQNPSMFNVWEKPKFAPYIELQSVNLWGGRLLSKRPKESPTHYDPYDSFFLQLTGKKTFIMYSALDTGNLYPRKMLKRRAPHPEDLYTRGKDDLNAESSFPNFSPIDPRRPNFIKFPRSQDARPVECDLNPGDALYMPAYTWHSVISKGNKKTRVNLGVNAWFHGDGRFQQLFETLLRLFQKEDDGLRQRQRHQSEL